MGLLFQANNKISSFDQKPANGGTPAIANHPMMKVKPVIGITLRKAPMRRMSCSLFMP